jgi:hypothetical protein
VYVSFLTAYVVPGATAVASGCGESDRVGRLPRDCHGSVCNMRMGVETHPYWILNRFGQVEAGRCGWCNEGALT